MKRSWIISIMLLAGCTSNTGPHPAFISGNYYMGGDPACATYKVHPTNSRILCYNGKGQPTQERVPLTPQQMAMYQQAQAQQAQQPAYVPQPMPVIQYPTMATPQVTPLGRPGGSQMRCIGVGIYANCKTY